MRRGWLLLACVLTLALWTAGAWVDAAAQEDAKAEEEATAKLIGSGKCKICHKKEKTGNQYGIWTESAHANAFATLGTDAAKAVATEKGLGDPQQAKECLSCHVTSAFLGEEVAAMDSYSHEEGVGCEACHGAGSDYKSMKVMKDAEAAQAAGLLMQTGAEHCQKCHNENSPTFKEFNYEERWAQIAHPKPTAE